MGLDDETEPRVNPGMLRVGGGCGSPKASGRQLFGGTASVYVDRMVGDWKKGSL